MNSSNIVSESDTLEEAVNYSVELDRQKSEFGYSPNEQRMILMAYEIRRLRRDIVRILREGK